MTRSAALRNLLIAVTVVGILLLMASAFPLGMSPEIFDSGESVTTWSVFIALWLMPALLILGIAIAWVGFARNARKIVVCGLALAALPVLIAIGVIVMAG
jgi:small-conductance mechanosensitive channel